MKCKKYIILAICTIANIIGCSNKEIKLDESIKEGDTKTEFFQVDPLFKIVRNSVPARVPVRLKESLIHAARGEYVSVQFVVQSSQNIIGLTIGTNSPTYNNSKLEVAQKGFVDYVGIGYPIADRLIPRGLISSTNEYPDPIITDRSVDIPANTLQPIWLTIKVPNNATEGIYKGNVIIKYYANGKAVEKVEELAVKVYSVDINSKTLKISNQFVGRPEQLKYFNGGIVPEYYSTRHWELLQQLAKFISPYRQNVIYVYPTMINMSLNQSTGKYSFDFSRLDKWIETFMDEGISAGIEGGLLASGFTVNGSEEVGVWVPKVGNRVTGFENEQMSIDDPRVTNFLLQYLPALRQHLINRGWYDLYVQHLADEPSIAMSVSYNKLRELVKSVVPDMKIIEAILHNNIDPIDVWVPKLDNLDLNYSTFFKNREQNGEQVWFYVCNDPVGKWANRFIEQELIYTRLLHWINFKYDLPGYLHWALGDWASIESGNDISKLYKETSKAWTPAGDMYIIYPGTNKILYSSIRFEAMREGIQDYELLKMLQAKNPTLASEIVNSVVKSGFGNYDSNIENFRKIRVKILEGLKGI